MSHLLFREKETNGLVKPSFQEEQIFPAYLCADPTSQTISPLSSVPCPFTRVGKFAKGAIGVTSLPRVRKKQALSLTSGDHP